MNWGRRTINKVVSRQKHDSLIAAGAGGRSSFSGQAATVFGSTGFVGHSLVNNLGRIGSSVVLPIRGTTERHQGIHIFRLKSEKFQNFHFKPELSFLRENHKNDN